MPYSRSSVDRHPIAFRRTLQLPRRYAQTPNRRSPQRPYIDEGTALYLHSLVTIQRSESDGLWSRFNIVVSVNVALIVLAGYVIANAPDGGQVFMVLLSVAGVIDCLWSIHVLHRLWLWHDYWVSLVQSAARSLPPGIPKLYEVMPVKPPRVRGRMRAAILRYTQPFLLVFGVVWATLGLLGAAFPTALFPQEDKEIQRMVVEFHTEPQQAQPRPRLSVQ